MGNVPSDGLDLTGIGRLPQLPVQKTVEFLDKLGKFVLVLLDCDFSR